MTNISKLIPILPKIQNVLKVQYYKTEPSSTEQLSIEARINRFIKNKRMADQKIETATNESQDNIHLRNFLFKVDVN